MSPVIILQGIDPYYLFDFLESSNNFERYVI